MAQRRIGQESFRFDTRGERQTNLDALCCLIDWVPADLVLSPLYPAVKGEKAWPPLAMFKALLLATWYDLSDVMLAEALSDRASFRRFCGFARDEETPERTAFVRFRRLLVAHGLDQSLFAAIARDLDSKGATVRKGTSPQSLTAIASLIDATVIGSEVRLRQICRWSDRDKAILDPIGDLVIAISTGGRSPALARRLRVEISEQFGPEWQEFVELLGEVRMETLADLPEIRERSRRWQQALHVDELLGLIRAGRRDEARSLLLARLVGVGAA